ncbi:hypothetical protein LINPERPRIM_LOCUS25652 [Linum perenne]
MVAMFLLTVGHNAKNRTCQVVFHRSGETVNQIIHSVLVAILKLHKMMLAKPSVVPDNCNDHRWKYFKGCLGALDGTIINMRTRTTSQTRYRTRKGTTGINCLGFVNQIMQFIYYLAGGKCLLITAKSSETHYHEYEVSEFSKVGFIFNLETYIL